MHKDSCIVDKNEQLANEDFCLSEKYISKETLNTVTNKTFNEHGNLCLNTEEIITVILKLVSSRQSVYEREVETSDDINFTPVSVHILLKSIQRNSEPLMSGVSTQHQHFLLSAQTGTSDPSLEHIRGAGAINEGLMIQFTGLYFVYSNLRLIIKANSSDSKFGTTYSSFVHRVSSNSPWNTGVLLRSVYTCPKHLDVEETIFNAGIFYLQKNDMIQVCLSGNNINSDNVSTTLGLFMLSSTYIISN